MKKKGKNTKAILRDYGIIIIFLVIVAFMMIVTPTFRKPMNLLNIIKQSSVNGILAFGMMIVVLTAGIDLSMGSIVGVSGVCAALFAHPGEYPLIVPVLVAIFVGMIFGMINGIGVAYGDLPPFIITLGTMSIGRGLALVISDGIPVINLAKGFTGIASSTFLGIPSLTFFFVGVIAFFSIILNKTVFGRHVYMIGGNAVAAKVSGINVKLNLVIVYTLAGVCSGLGGMLMASRTNQGSPQMGLTYEMDAVTAVVIGGVSMSGGVGRCYGVVIGALMIAVIENALTIFGVDANWKQVVKGLIIIGAVLLDVKSKGKKE